MQFPATICCFSSAGTPWKISSGSPAFVGKASNYKVDVPDHGFTIDLQGHNAVQGSFRFEAA
jgi:hypothetical protein